MGSWLPLNRKERFYTGTVLPMIICSDAFAHLHRFLILCSLDVATFDQQGHHLGQKIQFFTEYSFAQSAVTKADLADFPEPRPGDDTPDIVIAGEDWLLAVEAKMFHNPSPAALRMQMKRQRVVVDYLADAMSIPKTRVAHVLLIPDGLAANGVCGKVLRWEEVLDDYKVVGPPYWLSMLRQALSRYTELVSGGPTTFGQNKDDDLTGAEIVTAHAAGTLDFTYMGRGGGLTGARLTADIATGSWRTHTYEVRLDPFHEPNWFPITEFIACTLGTTPDDSE